MLLICIASALGLPSAPSRALVEAVRCPSGCSGRGRCRDDGRCLCDRGWQGAGCVVDTCASHCSSRGGAADGTAYPRQDFIHGYCGPAAWEAAPPAALSPAHAGPNGPTRLLTAMIKMCDLGHAFKPWAQHERWSNAVTEEFFALGDRERESCVLVSPL